MRIHPTAQDLVFVSDVWVGGIDAIAHPIGSMGIWFLVWCAMLIFCVLLRRFCANS